MNPYISVIVTTNRIGGLDILFEGLRRQTYQNFELILIDAIYEKRKEVIKEKSKNYNFMTKHIAPMDNTFPISNYCKSINTGLCVAQGTVAYFTCDYSYLDENCLLYHANFHLNNPENYVFIMPVSYYGLIEERLSHNFPKFRQYGHGSGELQCQLLVASEKQYVDIHEQWTNNYIQDLNNNVFDNFYWSIFDNYFDDKDHFNDIGYINYSGANIDNRFSDNIMPVIPELCSLKNDSFKLSLLLKANGLNEELDGTHGFQDTELSRRLAKLYDAKFFASNLSPVSIINIRHYLEPRKIVNGYKNIDIINSSEMNTLPITNNTITKTRKTKMKLNLGSGIGGFNALNVITTDHTGWKNIEICEHYDADEHYDISTGIREADNSIEEIWMGDFFEHLLRLKAIFVLQECFRVLQVGGKIRISVPDMEKVMPLWLASDGDVGYAPLIWGQQDELYQKNSFPDSHLYGYMESSLTKLFAASGFSNIKRISIHGVWYELALIAQK